MLQVFSMPCGFLELDSKLFFPDQETGSPLVVPVPCYLITHPQGNVLFDTGVHCAVMDDPVGRLGPEVSNLIVSKTKPGEEIVAQLSKFKLTPNDVSHVVNSHFHFDHAGGNEFFPTSTFLVQKNELDATKDPELRAKALLDPQDYDHPLNYQAVDGEQDIFGDGSLVIIPTHGHTPGHQSLRVKVGKGTEVVLTGDACYTRGNAGQGRQGHGSRADRGCVLHPGQYGSRPPAVGGGRRVRDVPVSEPAAGATRQGGRDHHLWPRPRPVAGDSPRARAPGLAQITLLCRPSTSGALRLTLRTNGLPFVLSVAERSRSTEVGSCPAGLQPDGKRASASRPRCSSRSARGPAGAAPA